MSEVLDFELTDNESVKRYRKEVWNSYVQKMKEDGERITEIKEHIMKYGEVKMKYGLQVIGDADENGYPLYIALHGGGQSDTPEINDSQWNHMAVYYKMGIKNGIYVNPRGVRDTWDTHANPESYPLYDRLIENMILFYDADPNRIYLLGYSAGGDGVYMVAPRMADRFAAVNMSAGHPNGTSVMNLYNTPIQLQVGEQDTAYSRHRVTAEYDLKLDKLADRFGGGYAHNVFIHYNKGHGFYDNTLNLQTVITDNEGWLNGRETDTKQADTNAIHFLDRYKREPLPGRVIWDLGNRAPLRKTTCFYWLKASNDVSGGEITANYNRAANTVTIESESVNGKFSVLLNDEMADLSAPITFVTPKGSFKIKADLSKKLIEATTCERGDANYQFAAEIKYSEIC